MINYYSSDEKIMKLVHPCRCNKCENPCKFGSGAFIKGEISKSAKLMGLKKKKFEKEYTEELTKFNTTLRRPKILREDDKPYGKCIFYEEDVGCKIHQAKPYECKVAMGCKSYGEELITWFDLKFFLNPEDKESLRQYKIYVESGGHVLDGAQLEHFKEKIKELDDYKDIKKSRHKDWDKILGLKDEDSK